MSVAADRFCVTAILADWNAALRRVVLGDVASDQAEPQAQHDGDGTIHQCRTLVANAKLKWFGRQTFRDAHTTGFIETVLITRPPFRAFSTSSIALA